MLGERHRKDSAALMSLEHSSSVSTQSKRKDTDFFFIFLASQQRDLTSLRVPYIDSVWTPGTKCFQLQSRCFLLLQSDALHYISHFLILQIPFVFLEAFTQPSARSDPAAEPAPLFTLIHTISKPDVQPFPAPEGGTCAAEQLIPPLPGAAWDGEPGTRREATIHRRGRAAPSHAPVPTHW